MSALTLTKSETVVTYEPRGVARDLFTNRQPEVVLSGPAGTGKSRACFEKLHLCLSKYPGARGLVLRKTLSSLTASGLVTFRRDVLHPLDGVTFFSGNKERPAQYEYPNGSVLVVGGLDKADKVMSTEYDMIYVQEATELTENDWESLTTRLRSGVMPYHQMIADCNPSAPTHWLKRRADADQVIMLDSKHRDNLILWDGDWTEEGTRYMGVLDRLTGVRRDRLRDGKWVAAEGTVYDFRRSIHLIDSFEIPRTWRRFRAVDFGFTNPFVCHWWAIDPDGRMYLYREHYQTQQIVAEHAKIMNAYSTGEVIAATVCDHDAEDQATLRANSIPTLPAYKAISRGIQAVEDRLRLAGDEKPRLFLFRDCLIARDEALASAGKPYCTEQEFDSYVWPKATDGRPVKEVPVDVDNHGMDTMRYAVAWVDQLAESPGPTANRFVVSPPRPITQYTPR